MKKPSARARRTMYWITIVILSCVFIGSLCMLLWYSWQSGKSESAYSDLEEMVNSARPVVTLPVPTEPAETQPSQSAGDTPAPTTQPAGDTPAPTTQPDATEPTESPWVTVVDPETGEERQILPEYAQVYLMNNDLVGWLSIEGTDISYPVMQTPDTPDFYLRRGFNKEYSIGGCLYIEEAADVFKPSDNLTIYGHRMSDGSMFAQLINYTKESFLQEHPYIRFDTLTERHLYQIVFVFRTTATLGEGFDYHNFIDAASENAFNAFVAECGWNQAYDIGIEVKYGDKLITLSTCEYSQPNGRFVVVAKRIS